MRKWMREVHEMCIHITLNYDESARLERALPIRHSAPFCQFGRGQSLGSSPKIGIAVSMDIQHTLDMVRVGKK